MEDNNQKCTKCGKDYKNQPIYGKEPELCVECTLFLLKVREETLNEVKHALHGSTYWPEIKKIKARRELLK